MALTFPITALPPSMDPRTTLTDLGRVLADAASAHDIRHVVGLSFGTIVALELVMSRPQAFTTLTLGAPALAGGPVDHAVGARFKELMDLYKLRGAGPWMTELWMRCPPITFAYASDSLRARLVSVIDRHAWSELARPGTGILSMTRQTQDLHRLLHSTAKQLYIIGEHELPAFRRTAEILLKIRPDARFAELPGAGHLCLLQSPQETAALLTELWRCSG
jgi:pimeloyl-ACP methyl ester carboxylesterase